MLDAIIIGSGPAGSTAAKILSSAGLKVVVAELKKLPRYKSCSGVLIEKSVRLVKEYFNTDIPPQVTCPPSGSRGMVLYNDEGKRFEFGQGGYNVWRAEFDHMLVRKAERCGAEIRDNTAAVDYKREKDSVTVTFGGKKQYTEKAKFVIDCSGAAGTLKHTALHIPRAQNIITYQTFNRGSIDLDPQFFYAYLQPGLSEYDAWFNVKDGMLVLGVSVKNPAHIPLFYKNFTEYMQKNHGLEITETVRGEKWIMPYIRPDCNIIPGTERVLFAGEAAGFLNPMGEGISAALESGFLAATAVTDNIENPQAALSCYTKSLAGLKTYMMRQWSFAGQLSQKFGDMKIQQNVSGKPECPPIKEP